MTILILKTGSAPDVIREEHGDFEHWFEDALGEPCECVDVRDGDPGALPEPEAPSAIVITGSAAMVSERPGWAEALLPWLRRAVASTPTLGVCFGHQLIAHALGGRVGRNPRGRIVASVETLLVEIETDPLLGGFGEAALVQCVHQEVVLDLPPGARVRARAPHDPHHAIHFGARAWGVQFHPEFDAEIIRAYLEWRRDELSAAGFDVEALSRAARSTPAGFDLLRRFAGLSRGAGRPGP